MIETFVLAGLLVAALVWADTLRRKLCVSEANNRRGATENWTLRGLCNEQVQEIRRLRAIVVRQAHGGRPHEPV